MRSIVLKSIELENWSSINLKVNFNDSETIIRGKNGTGKTSIINAWRWLLTGRIDPNHPANYEIFDQSKPINKDTPEAIVTAVVGIDGFDFELCKKAKALFVREKGSTEYTKAKSDKYTTLIDGVEYNATTYKNWIEKNICPFDMLNYCIDGSFFTSLCEDDKKKSRNVLLNIVGDVKEDEFMCDYSMVKDLIKNKNVEIVKDMLSEKSRNIDKNILSIKTKIDILTASLSEESEFDIESMKKNLSSKKEELRKIDEQISQLADAKTSDIDLKREIESEVFSLKNKIEEERRNFEKEWHDSLTQVENEINEAKGRNSYIEESNNKKINSVPILENQIQQCKECIQVLKDVRLTLLAERDKEMNVQFTETKCPYCGGDLPEDMLESAKKNFLEKKNQRIKEIVKKGKMNNEEILAQQKNLEYFSSNLESCKNLKDLLDTKELENKKMEIIKNKPCFEDSDSYKKISSKIEILNRKIENIHSVDISDYVSKKTELYSEIEDLSREIGSHEKPKHLKEDISNLKKEYKDVCCKKAETEGMIIQCKDYIEERALLISNKVNQYLNKCKIQMWSVLKNGEKNPDCVILDKNGVKYGKTNTAERIKINIEIQKMFNNKYQIQFPIFIDECSVFSTFNIPQLDSQHIMIFASDSEISIE